MAYKLNTIRSGATEHPEMMVDFLAVAMISNSGVADVYGGHMEVTAHITELKVKIAEGRAFLRKEDGSMVYPVNQSLGEAVIDVTSNSSGNPRIDAVVIYADLNETTNADATNVIKFHIVEGLPAATPQAPSDSAIEADIGAANPYTRLANIKVENGASVVQPEDVEDTRIMFGISNNFDMAEVGDIKITSKLSVSGRWLLMESATIGNTGSGATYQGPQYKDLFEHMESLNYTPTSSWETGGRISIINARERMPYGAPYDGFVGGLGGSNSQTIAGHNHTMTHTHNISHYHTMNHTHGIAHTHTYAHYHKGYGGPNTRSGKNGSEGTDYEITTDWQNTATTSGSSVGSTGGASTGNTGGASSSTSGGSSANYTGTNSSVTISTISAFFGVNYFIRY